MTAYDLRSSDWSSDVCSSDLRYYADGMLDLPEDRGLAILAVCTLEWRSSLADVIVETHDRIVGRLYRASERLCNTRIADEKAAVRDTLKSFAEIGGALLGAQDDRSEEGRERKEGVSKW